MLAYNVGLQRWLQRWFVMQVLIIDGDHGSGLYHVYHGHIMVFYSYIVGSYCGWLRNPNHQLKTMLNIP